MKHLTVFIASLLVAMVGCIIVFFAVVGFACLFMTSPAVSEKQSCAMIQTINDHQWCLNALENDGVPTTTFNPQKTTSPQEPADNTPVWME